MRERGSITDLACLMCTANSVSKQTFSRSTIKQISVFAVSCCRERERERERERVIEQESKKKKKLHEVNTKFSPFSQSTLSVCVSEGPGRKAITSKLQNYSSRNSRDSGEFPE